MSMDIQNDPIPVSILCFVLVIGLFIGLVVGCFMGAEVVQDEAIAAGVAKMAPVTTSEKFTWITNK